MSSNNSVFFLSGGNRGIGFAIVKKLSEQRNTTVITTARAPESATELQELIKTHPNVHVIKYDASSQDISHVSKEAERISGEGIDVFISNSAIEESRFPVIEEKVDIWIKHYSVNVLGPILLTQALYPLLIKKQTRKIVFVSSSMGSMGQFIEMSGSAYGQSKAALNYTAKELSFELREKGFIIVPIHPGVVTSDMGSGFISRLAVKDPAAASMAAGIAFSADKSASFILDLVKGLTLKQSGKFLNYDGSVIAF